MASNHARQSTTEIRGRFLDKYRGVFSTGNTARVVTIDGQDVIDVDVAWLDEAQLLPKEFEGVQVRIASKPRRRNARDQFVGGIRRVLDDLDPSQIPTGRARLTKDGWAPIVDRRPEIVQDRFDELREIGKQLLLGGSLGAVVPPAVLALVHSEARREPGTLFITLIDRQDASLPSVTLQVSTFYEEFDRLELVTVTAFDRPRGWGEQRLTNDAIRATWKSRHRLSLVGRLRASWATLFPAPEVMMKMGDFVWDIRFERHPDGIIASQLGGYDDDGKHGGISTFIVPRDSDDKHHER